MGTLADTRFGSTTFNGACVFSGRALDSDVTLFLLLPVVVGTLDWNDGVFSDPSV